MADNTWSHFDLSLKICLTYIL